MNIINHPLCTTTIGAPPDMQDDCSALPVAYHTDEFGTWTTSFWQPSVDELAMLTAGGGITLQVRAAGRQHPVVAMGVWPSISPIPTGISAYRAADGSTACSYRKPAPVPQVRAEIVAQPVAPTDRDAALEDAAQLCDTRSDKHKYGPRWDSTKGAEAGTCASEIRALKKQAAA